MDSDGRPEPLAGSGLRALLTRALLFGLWQLPLTRALPILRRLSRRSCPRGAIGRWARETLGVAEADLPDWWSRAVFGARARVAVLERALAGRIDELAPVLLPADLSPLRELLDEGKGVILAGAHFGPPCAVRYVLMKAELPRLSLTWDVHAWDPASLAIADASTAARSLTLGLDRLRDGGLLHTAPDSPRGSRTLGVSLLGSEVRLSRSLATMARLTGAPALPVVAGWEGERIRVSFGARLPAPVGADPESWERAWLSGYARWYELQMRGAPENLGLMQRW